MHVVDDLAVALAILVSVVYALLALGPRALRARLLSGSGALLLRLPRFAGLSGLGLRLRDAARGMTLGKGPGACGGCDSCGSAPSPPEVRIPLSQIGRR